MRAGLIQAWGAVPVFDQQAPTPSRGPGEVLVRIEVAALNRLDLTAASGLLGTDRELPYIAGVEGAGVVVETDDNTALPVGTKVLVRGAGVGLQRPGCWAEFVSVPADAVLEVPATLSPELAATFFQPTCAAWIALYDVASLREGETVIVVGAAGAVGSQVVQLALAAGNEVIGVVGRAGSLSRVPAGARAVLMTDQAAVRDLEERRPGTLLVDTLGGDNLIGRSHWVGPGGRVVVIGYLQGMTATLDIPRWMMDGVALLPMNMLQQVGRARELAPKLATMVADGALTVDVESFSMLEAPEALERLRAGDIRGRAVMTL